MSRRFLIGYFTREADVLAATSAARARGYEIVDVYTPYAVHGLDQAMGIRPSRITLACFFGGLAGCALAWWLQIFTSAQSWPLNVGGKPMISGPAFVPVAFELTILFAGLSVFAATLVRSRLFPGQRPRLALSRVTDDRFAIVLHMKDAAFSPALARRLLEERGAVTVEERDEQEVRK